MKHATLPPIAVSRETRDRLDALIPLLLRWNASINLIADRNLERVEQRHVQDSLQLLPLIPAGEAPLGDFGSGGGFPGLVLAAALTRPVHLVESDKRKAVFLAEAARHLALPHVTVHAERIDAARLPPLAVATARALAPLPELLALVAPHLRADAVAVFPKGKQAEMELTAAREGWQMQVERIPSRTDPAATILRLSEIRRVGAAS